MMPIGFDTAASASRRKFLLAAGGFIAAAGFGAPALAQSPKQQLLPAFPPMPPIPDLWLQAETLQLWPDGPPSGGFKKTERPKGLPDVFVNNVARPELRVFRPKASNGRALLSIPGGAYMFVSILNEGIDIAASMTALGYTVFVLTYRLPAEGWINRSDVPLQDAQRAIRIIRANAVRYGFDPAAVAGVGFSAGGHLAACLATGFGETVYEARDSIDVYDSRPAAMGLIYPVISMTAPVTHAISASALLGPDPSPDLIERRSPARRVSSATPPIFLVHAIDDQVVPVENSLSMMRSMREAGRPVEAHIFEAGGHGFGLGSPNAPSGRWLDLFSKWLDGHLPAHIS